MALLLAQLATQGLLQILLVLQVFHLAELAILPANDSSYPVSFENYRISPVTRSTPIMPRCVKKIRYQVELEYQRDLQVSMLVLVCRRSVQESKLALVLDQLVQVPMLALKDLVPVTILAQGLVLASTFVQDLFQFEFAQDLPFDSEFGQVAISALEVLLLDLELDLISTFVQELDLVPTFVLEPFHLVFDLDHQLDSEFGQVTNLALEVLLLDQELVLESMLVQELFQLVLDLDHQSEPAQVSKKALQVQELDRESIFAQEPLQSAFYQALLDLAIDLKELLVAHISCGVAEESCSFIKTTTLFEAEVEKNKRAAASVARVSWARPTSLYCHQEYPLEDERIGGKWTKSEKKQIKGISIIIHKT
nr:unnamed protein product [Callosobruchus chinensis]